MTQATKTKPWQQQILFTVAAYYQVVKIVLHKPAIFITQIMQFMQIYEHLSVYGDREAGLIKATTAFYFEKVIS